MLFFTSKIWDTAGADRFPTITNEYYRGSHLVVIVLDLTDSFCLENAKRYLQNCDNFCHEDVLKVDLPCLFYIKTITVQSNPSITPPL